MTNIIREGAIAVIERAGRYLVITRSATVIAPGKICFPGGGIEPGETPQQALVRECREELGVEIVPGDALGVSVTPWKVRLHWFAATLAEDVEFQPDPREVAAVHWMTLQEMFEHPDVLESNIPFLETIARTLRKD